MRFNMQKLKINLFFMHIFFNSKNNKGFTLIELMMIIAIIGILVSILMPKFTGAIRKTHEGRTKGYLGSLRSALAIYFGDMDGYYPVGADSAGAVSNGVMTATLVPKYIKEISDCYTPIHHGKSNQEAN